MGMLKTANILLSGMLIMCVSCAEAPPEAPVKAPPKAPLETPPAVSPKIELDLSKLDANGMRGSGSGKVLAAYEFAIPNTDKCKAEVKAIAPGIRIMSGSRGRIRAGKDECLCIGETDANYRTVLKRLADLPYVKRIIECHFE
jgi:hypothetical protein